MSSEVKEGSNNANEFRNFALTCDAIRATRSKLEKIRILAEYFLTLKEDRDLSIASTFLSGRVFPPGSVEQETNVGYSILWNVISELTNLKDLDISEYYRRHGDLGAALEDVLREQVGRSSPPSSSSSSITSSLLPFSDLDSYQRPSETLFQNKLTLEGVYSAFVDLSKSIGQKSQQRKRQILLGLFSNIRAPVEAKYIVKILTNEMRIGLVEGLVEESIASAFSKPLQKVRVASLILANTGLLAVEARHDRLDMAQLAPLRPTNFMLADNAPTAQTLYEKLKTIPVYSEYKYDGIRAQLHLHNGQAKIFSRNLADVTRFFPELEYQAKTLGNNISAIFDGEIIAFGDGKPLSFQLLQRRLRKIERSPEDAPIKYVVFDLLFLNDSSLIGVELETRMDILHSIKLDGSIMAFSEQRRLTTAEEISDMFFDSKRLGYEGLVAKDPSSAYLPGRRGSSWIKLKKELDTLDVVIVAAEYGHGKRAGVISDYTFAVGDGDELRVIGKAYSGLTDLEIKEMTGLLKSIAVEDQGYRMIVKPQIVLEVAFDAIQKSDRHDSGFALRFPRIKRIRTDKSVQDIDTLEKVKKIHEDQIVRA